MEKLFYFVILIIILIYIWVDDFNQKQKQDFDNKIYYHHKKAEQGDLKSQNILADLYARGVALKFNKNYGVNLQNSAYWHEQSALKGDKDAQYNIANIYENGIGVAVNLQNANYWYYQSALQGNHLSQYRLAQNFENGKGITQSYQDAMYWYIKLAEQGDKKAIYKVGVVYDDGLWGFNENDKLALFWLDKLNPNDKNNPFELRQRLIALKYPVKIPQQQYVSNTKSYSSQYYGHSRQCTATCWDGTCSKSLGRRGVCSRHGGVKYWH